jgi:hypothetical protein
LVSSLSLSLARSLERRGGGLERTSLLDVLDSLLDDVGDVALSLLHRFGDGHLEHALVRYTPPMRQKMERAKAREIAEGDGVQQLAHL